MPEQKAIEKSLIISMIILVLYGPLAIDIYLPAFPEMAEAFSVGTARIQDTMIWFMFSIGIGQLLAGPLTDRFGRRPIALYGIVIYIFSAALISVTESLNVVLVARLVQGVGACACSVASFAAVRDCFGANRSGRMFSYLNGSICFITASAPILGSWLTSQFGWYANFSFMVLFALVTGIFIAIKFKETRPLESNFIGNIVSVSRYKHVLNKPVFIYHACLCMLSMTVIMAYVTSAPVWLMMELGLDSNQFTIWFGINATLNIIACVFTPKVLDKFGLRKTLKSGIIILLCSGGLMFTLSEIREAWAFMVPLFIASFGYALVLASAAGKALASFGNNAGTAAALLGLFQMSGSALIVSFFQRLNLHAPILLSLLMFLLAPSLVILWLKPAKQWYLPSLEGNQV